MIMDKTLTFTVTDALLSPVGFSILSGAGLFNGGDGNQGTETKDLVHFHMSSLASVDADGKIDLTDAISEFGDSAVCSKDAPVFVMEVEDDGSLTGKVYDEATIGTDGKSIIMGSVKSTNVMVDYYVDLPGESVYEADITADTFAGYYYVEASTLFRDQATGKDLPANLTLPNVKLQSNFTITMAGTGDPSTFDFTMDAFPGYTYFDKTKKVLCVLQIANANKAEKKDHPVMPHNETLEHEEIHQFDSIVG